jgi:O-antigen ligase
MNTILILGLIIALQAARMIFFRFKGKDITHLWVSTYLITIPLTFSKVISVSATWTNSGTFGPNILVTFPLLLGAILFFKSNFKNLFQINFKGWIFIVTLFAVVSIFNPYNENPGATLVFASIFYANIFFLLTFGSYVNAVQLLKGIFDGFSILTVSQLLLAICFPILNISLVTTLFHPDGALGATREGTRPGAVGLFSHPGRLAMFSLLASSYYLSNYLYNYKKQLSLILLVFSAITVFLTFSRTSYLGFVIVVVLLIFVKRNGHSNLFSFQNLFKIILPSCIAIGYIVFLSPISGLFLKGDSETQVMNRTIHYKIGYEIFQKSPLIGVGLNAHVAYINKHPSILGPFLYDSKAAFYKTNPIHNIHLIVLAETGIIGFFCWIFFILRNIYLSSLQIRNNRNQILSLAFIGVLVTTTFYGLTGWSPFTMELFPFFLFFVYIGIAIRTN